LIYSKTCEYAIRALLFLAAQKKGEYVSAVKVSRETGVPGPYLAKIFQELSRAKIIDSRRGVAGGAMLAKDPEKISLRLVMETIDDPEHLRGCVMGLDRCSDTNACPLHAVWSVSKQKILDEMEKCNLMSIKKKIMKAKYRGLKRGRLNLDLMMGGSGAA